MQPKRRFISVLLLLITGSCTAFAGPADEHKDTATWFDASRKRAVPVAVYQPTGGKIQNQQLIILSPGYGGKNTDYGFIADNLAKRGYTVVTVQHDLPSDPPIPSGENLYQRRLPFWKTGVSNILFVIEQLKKEYPQLDYHNLILIGHSNGGDISMLLGKQHPDFVTAVISLDNRRMPFPRTVRPHLFSIRSKDQIGDEGVIPTDEEQKKYNISVLKVNTNHNDMGGYGTPQQLAEINGLILRFLAISVKADTNQFAGLKDTIAVIAASAKATVGVAVMDLNTRETLTVNREKKFPMQSVFKFPLAMAILDQVDRGKLQLQQKIKVSKNDLSIPFASPLRDKYPEGNIDITLAELLRYTVSQSDNNGCDILFRLAGGTKAVNDYIHSIGANDIAIVATEKEMGVNSAVQYTNWCKPEAMLLLLEKLHSGTVLSKKSNAFLWQLMIETVNAPKRIKGALPAGTVVGHKPGTSGTSKDGFTATTNDVGIVELPDKRRFAIVLFICDSAADRQSREGAMASITKIIWDSYLKR